MKKSIHTISILILIFAFTGSFTNAQNWNVPNSAKKVQNPLESSSKNINSGKKLYNIHCKSCHGDPTMNNMLPLAPIAPSDLGSQAFLVQPDGEIFYKLNKGLGAMPTFEKTISDNDKWMIISYLRSFDKNKKISLKVEEINNPEVTDVNLAVDISEADKKIAVLLTGLTKKGNRVGLEGIELSFMVRREFGYLDISGEDPYTNKSGKLDITFPTDLPGDTEGMVNILVKITDENSYGKLEKNQMVALGVPTIPENLLNKRVMWGTRANAPIWIIATFIGGIIFFWSVIFWVIFQMLSLPKLAKNKD
nr:c-type cytochrome [uncultured Marinifilum sp.]